MKARLLPYNRMRPLNWSRFLGLGQLSFSNSVLVGKTQELGCQFSLCWMGNSPKIWCNPAIDVKLSSIVGQCMGAIMHFQNYLSHWKGCLWSLNGLEIFNRHGHCYWHEPFAGSRLPIVCVWIFFSPNSLILNFYAEILKFRGHLLDSAWRSFFFP